MKPLLRGPLLGLASAALFGAATPVAKLLLASIDAWMLAGLLYLSAGAGLITAWLLLRGLGLSASEPPLTRANLPVLAGVIVAGGVAGPVLLFAGLTRMPAAEAALLLNLEGLATMVIAWAVFRESVDRRLLAGAGAILAGAVLLSWQSQGVALGLGALAVAGACLAWGIDNNLTRKLSGGDPVTIAAVKGIAAGGVNLAIAFAIGGELPAPGLLGLAALTGVFGYGVSLVLFILALRHLGAARTGAYFSTAPFIAALLAVAFLGEPLSPVLLIAGGLMALGVWLHVSESHAHEHVHTAEAHDHLHTHDAHHDHRHHAHDPPGVPHAHPHQHTPLRHSHPHYPDLHHRHPH